MQPITPFLWFDNQTEEAVKFYTSVFRNSKIGKTTRYTEAGQEIHQQKPGTVQSIAFELNGQPFMALNGGPYFKINEAISFMVFCETQAEVDHYWEKLSAVPESEQCGWLKDKFGVTWQVIPTELDKLLSDPDPARAQRATTAMLQMKKLDIAALKKAADGK